MSEWLSYRLSDLLLFSEATYFRLFELYNSAVWPLQGFMLALGALIAVLPFTGIGHRHRVICTALIAIWLWVGWGFHLQHYTTVNWAAPAFAVMFFAQSLLLSGFGLRGGRLEVNAPAHLGEWLGFGLLLYALVLHPLLAPLWRGAWRQAEVFGVAPDPTAMATLGVLLMSSAPQRWILLVIPLLWCLVSAATLWAMPNPQFAVPALAAVLTIGVIGLQSLRAASR